MARADAALTAPNPDAGWLAGRDAELAHLAAELDLALAERTFRLVVVRGPAGVGRSALLAAFGRALAARDVNLLSSRASRPRPAAYGLVAPLASAALELGRPTMTAAARASLEAGLAPLFGRPAKADAPDALAAAFTEVVAAAARDRALVLVADDADAADPASLSLLAKLVPTLATPNAVRAPDDAVVGGLVVLSVRDEAMPAALQALFARVAATSVALLPLDLEGVRSWLVRQGAERLYEATGGVPGRLLELVQSEGAIDFAARRLERLSAADREVLAAVAVLAHPSDALLVQRVSARRDAAARLGPLTRAHLVEASPASGRTLFSCAREADRQAVLGALSGTARVELETRAAEALAERGEVEAAFRLYLAAGDERAVPTGLHAAGELAGRAAYAVAREVLEQVVPLAADRKERAQALLALAEVAERQGEIRPALAALGRARAASDAASRRALRAKSARLCLAIGAPSAAERLARRVLAHDVADAAASEAVAALAEARFLRGAYDEALELATRDVDLPHRLRLQNTRGKALLTLGRLDEAREVFLQNAAGAERAGDDAERSRALLNVGVVAHRRGERAEALAAYRALLSQKEQPFAAIVHANLAALALEAGEAEEALRQSHRALALFARAGRTKEQAHATDNLARAYLYVGDLDRAGEVARHAAELAAHVGDPYLEAQAALVLGEVRLAAGEDDAASHLEASAERFEQLKSPRYRLEALLLVAEAQLQRARPDAALRSLARARDAGVTSNAALLAELHLLEAELQLARAEDSIAAASLASARRALVDRPQLELPARLYFLSGTLAERRGQPELAQAERQKAARLVEELAAKVPPERRPLFRARRHRRAMLDAAGQALPDVVRPAPPPVTTGPESPALVGRAPSILRVNALIDRLGPSTQTVLVRGESGTGKELVARALHEKSARRELPLVAVNCGALGEELLLSELFGHEKGAFTGAVRERKGRFELADGGTIFLDEIGDISPRAQVALLRVLQERNFERVGGSRTLTVDVRVVCATNRNLEALMAKGEFREDLYYRLKGATLNLPSLRERPEDLAPLCDHLLARHARARGEAPRKLSPEALALIVRYPWPGNVRELINVLEAASLFASGGELGPEAFELFPELFALSAPVATAHVPPAFAPGATTAQSSTTPATSGEPADFYALLRARDLSLKDLRRELDLACIQKALGEGSGNISEAARLLKMKRSRLSQIVNAEPSLRALCRGGQDPAADDGEDDE